MSARGIRPTGMATETRRTGTNSRLEREIREIRVRGEIRVRAHLVNKAAFTNDKERSDPSFPHSERVEEISKEMIRRSLMPENAKLDALHVASAAVGGVHYLLTLNCKHIANAHVLLECPII